MIAFHKQAMIKLNIYENILVSKTGMYYSPVIRFDFFVNMDKAKVLTKSNLQGKSSQKQQNRSQCGSIKHLYITTRDFPVGIYYRKAKNWPWGW